MIACSSRLALATFLVMAGAAPGWTTPSWPLWPGAARSAAAPSVEAAGRAEADRFATALDEAISSGDWARVQRFIPRPGTPALRFLEQRWHEMRARRLDPVAWDVTFAPFYMQPGHLGGRLRVAAREASGRVVAGRFDVELLSRADGWVVGDDLPIETPEVAVVAHDLAVDLTGGPAHFVATDALTLKPTGPDRRLFLALASGLAVTGASVDGKAYPVTQQDDRVFLAVPDGNDPPVVTLRYAGAIAPTATPKGGFTPPIALGEDLAWYPRPLDASAASFHLTARLAGATDAVAVGVAKPSQDDHGTRVFAWTTREPIAGEALFAGVYDSLGDDPGLGSLALLLAPSKLSHTIAADLLQAAHPALDFFKAHYGPYPYAGLALVQADVPAQSGSAATIPLATASLASPAAAHAAVVRGLARAWIDRAHYAGTPLAKQFMTDGVAAYMALLYRAQQEGPHGFRAGLAAAQEALTPPATPDDAATAEVRPAATADERLEARAVLVLHMLRKEVGNAAFDRAFQTLYGDPTTAAIGLDRFRAAFEKASGKHLEAFFHQWLDRDAVPAFALEEVAVAASGKDYEIAGTLVQDAPAYFMTMPIVVTTDAKPVLYNVPVRAGRTTFRLRAHARPRQILVNPLYDVLAAPVPPQDLDVP